MNDTPVHKLPSLPWTLAIWPAMGVVLPPLLWLVYRAEPPIIIAAISAAGVMAMCPGLLPAAWITNAPGAQTVVLALCLNAGTYLAVGLAVRRFGRLGWIVVGVLWFAYTAFVVYTLFFMPVGTFSTWLGARTNLPP